MCPSWPKEHDWKSCKRRQPFQEFESLHLRQQKGKCFRTSFFVIRRDEEVRNDLQEARRKCADWEKAPVELSIAGEENLFICAKRPRQLCKKYKFPLDNPKISGNNIMWNESSIFNKNCSPVTELRAGKRTCKGGLFFYTHFCAEGPYKLICRSVFI